jgi:hypothetical protein
VLLAEFEHETRTTRKHLERLPDERFDWRPHPKPVTAQLASHLVDCIRWTGPIFNADELDMDPSTLRPFCATSNAAETRGIACRSNATSCCWARFVI